MTVEDKHRDVAPVVLAVGQVVRRRDRGRAELIQSAVGRTCGKGERNVLSLLRRVVRDGDQLAGGGSGEGDVLRSVFADALEPRE